MRPFIVAGNWKMNGTLASVQPLLQSLVAAVRAKQYDTTTKLLVFPPSIFIPQTQTQLANTPIAYGAQNMSEYDNGAYTGELSASMLTDFGCHYVLVGHSERRQLFSEDNTQIAKKFIKCKQSKLTPILCVGETLAQREANQTQAVIQEQLQAIVKLDEDRFDLFQDSVIAYEPVWAIGTGKSATAEQAQEIHHWIRQYLTEIGQRHINALPILYGGSVKVDNAARLFEMPDIDGALVGGASLQADSFMGIAKCNKSS